MSPLGFNIIKQAGNRRFNASWPNPTDHAHKQVGLKIRPKLA